MSSLRSVAETGESLPELSSLLKVDRDDFGVLIGESGGVPRPSLRELDPSDCWRIHSSCCCFKSCSSLYFPLRIASNDCCWFTISRCGTGEAGGVNSRWRCWIRDKVSTTGERRGRGCCSISSPRLLRFSSTAAAIFLDTWMRKSSRRDFGGPAPRTTASFGACSLPCLTTAFRWSWMRRMNGDATGEEEYSSGIGEACGGDRGGGGVSVWSEAVCTYKG